MEKRIKKSAAGRPTAYTKELGLAICEKIAMNPVRLSINLESDNKFPCEATFYNWLSLYPELQDMYTLARERQADLLFYRMLEIVFDNSRDVIVTKKGMVINTAAVKRSNLQINTLKWAAARLNPRVYGEKMQFIANDNQQIENDINESIRTILSRRPEPELKAIAAHPDSEGSTTAITGQE